MTHDEALKLALEALETELSIDWTNNDEFNASAEKMYEAITAIKEVLAQAQEPFAYVNVEKRRLEFAHDYVKWDTPTTIKLDKIPLYITPPQRKPLTENEIKHLWYEACQTNLELTSQLIVHLARNIEAAHGIKENT